MTRLCMLVMAACLAVTGSVRAAIVDVMDAEAGALNQTAHTQACCADSLTLVSSLKRAGQQSVKSYVRGTDPPFAAHRRAEALIGRSVSGQYWYGWSVYLPADFQPDDNWHVITQWHTVPPIMQPLQLNVHGTHWTWENWIGIQPSAQYNVLFNEDFTADKGKWVDWVVNVNWSSGADGFIRIWKNGTQIVNRSGPVTYQGSNVYWKVGLVYDTSDTLTMYFDEMRMADANASYAEVAPVGAIVATAGAYPWIVALVNDSSGQHCGGALIRSNWVLTAGHCVVDHNTGQVIQPQSIHAVIGRTNLADSGGQVINAKQIILHPDYNNLTLDNDLALIELAAAASYPSIQLIGPSFSNSLIPDGTLLTALSWSTAAAPDGANADWLTQISIPAVPQNVCQQAYLATDPSITLTDNMFCAGYVSGVKDRCSSDSGGPLVVQGNNGWVQGGITSRGPSPNCGEDIYGVYTRVSNYSAWIAQNTCAASEIPSPPKISLSVSGNTVTVSWNPVPNAQGYRLYYAPYPYIQSQAEPVYNIDLGSRLSVSGTLPAGSAYYVGVHAYHETCYGDWSNIESFTIQ